MSEETPRLSRREMREQGLLKVRREDETVSHDDLRTRTSELQLHRPSRREIRLQRQANEAKVGEQSAKFNTSPFTGVQGSQPGESTGSRTVHSFDLFGSTSSPKSEPAQPSPMPSSGTANFGTSAFNGGKDVKEDKDALLSAPEAFGASEQQKDEKAEPAGSNRSSVFDRFGAQDKNSVSFRDRLVARTREGQQEARDSQPSFPAQSFDSPDAVEALTQAFEPTVSEADVSPDLQPGNKPSEDIKAEKEKLQALLGAWGAREKVTPEPQSATTPADTVVESAPVEKVSVSSVEATSVEHVETSVEKVDDKEAASLKPYSDVSSASDAVAEANEVRYPTDISMRLSDEDEEKSSGDNLFSALIILVGVLIGIVLGLIVQKVVFGAEEVVTDSFYSVQAVAQTYGIGV